MRHTMGRQSQGLTRGETGKRETRERQQGRGRCGDAERPEGDGRDAVGRSGHSDAERSRRVKEIGK